MKKKKDPGPTPRRPVRGIAITLLLAAAALTFARAGFAVRLGGDGGSVFVASHNIAEEDFGHPALRALREREKLDQVTAAGATQFEKIVLLRGWTRRQWEPGSRFYYPPWDAAEILDLARKKGNRGFCAQYAVVFLQAALSMGVHARYVDLPGHFTVETWSDDHGKWVQMDPYFDVHYERDGLPLDSRALNEAYWKGDADSVFIVDGAGGRKRASRKDLELYRMCSIFLRNNHLSSPLSVIWRGSKRRLRHEADFRSYPSVGTGPETPVYVDTFVAFRTPYAGEQFADRPVLDDLDDYYRPKNRAVISARASGNGSVKVALAADESPSFGSFQVRSGEGEWQEAPAKMMGELKPGLNRISARIRTRYGWLGPESRVLFFYKPPWFRARRD